MSYIHLSLLLFLFALSAAQQCRQEPATYTFTIGSLNGTILTDGPLTFDTSPFLVPEAAIRHTYSRNYRTPFPNNSSQNVLLLDTPTARILFDMGSANFQTLPFFRYGGHALSNLRGAGFDPRSIDVVLLTHAHVDHVGGLVDGEGKAAYPNAKVYIGEEEHAFWSDPSVKNGNPLFPDSVFDVLVSGYRSSIKPYQKAGRFFTVKSFESPLPNITFVPSPGHSPGHNVISVTSDDHHFVHIGDAWFSKPTNLQNPEWNFFVEPDADEAYASRLSLLKRAARRRHLVLAYHEDFPGLGYVKEDGAAFDWIDVGPDFASKAIYDW